MNNNIMKIAFVGLVCAAFCATTFAAPKGGRHGGKGSPARAPQQTRVHQGGNGSPAKVSQQTRAHQGGNGGPIRAPQQTRVHQVGNGHAIRAPQQRHDHRVNQPAAGRHEHFRQEPRHHTPTYHVPRHHIPSNARYWARPAVPLWRVGALRAWEWIEQEWVIVVNGVYYYGDGYYYDGYNYYYNGEYHSVPPPLPAPIYF